MSYSQMAPLGSAALPNKELELLNALNSITSEAELTVIAIKEFASQLD